jgi:hypothetical protein
MVKLLSCSQDKNRLLIFHVSRRIDFCMSGSVFSISNPWRCTEIWDKLIFLMLPLADPWCKPSAYFIRLVVMGGTFISSGACLLKLSQKHSPSWEADSRSASEEIPRILRNNNVHYRVHKSPPLVPILDHMNPVHIVTLFLKTAVEIISQFPNWYINTSTVGQLLSPTEFGDVNRKLHAMLNLPNVATEALLTLLNTRFEDGGFYIIIHFKWVKKTIWCRLQL